MNANEVIANLAGEGVAPQRPREHGPVVQRRVPDRRAPRRARRGDATTCCRRSSGSRSAFAAKAEEFKDVVKAGRTHLMDAVPVTLGQEFAGYAAQIRLGARARRATRCRRSPRSRSAARPPAPASTPTPSSPSACARAGRADRPRRSAPPEDPFEAQGNRDALVELSGALKVLAVSLTKIANDLALMGSGPRAGIGELFLPELQKGSSIMPGKVNPVIPEVVIQVGRAGHRQRHGDHGRRPAGQLRAQRAGTADRPQPARVDPLLTANEPSVRREVRRGDRGQRGGLPALGRADAGGGHGAQPRHRLRQGGPRSSRRRPPPGRTLREVALEHGVDEATLDKALDLRRIAAGNRSRRLRRHAVMSLPPRPGGWGWLAAPVRVVQAFVTVGLCFATFAAPALSRTHVSFTRLAGFAAPGRRPSTTRWAC